MDTLEPLETFVLDEAAIANFVKLQRTFNGWKQDMLAAEADVSLATVSRVERGLKVRPAQLRKRARAGQARGRVSARACPPHTRGGRRQLRRNVRLD